MNGKFIRLSSRILLQVFTGAQSVSVTMYGGLRNYYRRSWCAFYKPPRSNIHIGSGEYRRLGSNAETSTGRHYSRHRTIWRYCCSRRHRYSNKHYYQRKVHDINRSQWAVSTATGCDWKLQRRDVNGGIRTIDEDRRDQ